MLSGRCPDDVVYVNTEAVAGELAAEYCGLYSDKTPNVGTSPFLSQIYRPWGLVVRKARVRSLVPSRGPQRARHRSDNRQKSKDTDHDEETAFGLLRQPDVRKPCWA